MAVLVRWIIVLVWPVAIIAMMALPSVGQEIDDTPAQLWLSYQYQNKVRDQVRVYGKMGYEELLSSERFFGEWTRLYLTGGASYDVRPWLRIAGGLGTYYTYHPETHNIFELRPWQEATLFWPEIEGWTRRLVVSHRLRLEERFTNAEDWDIAARVRYRIETKLPINAFSLERGSFYIPVSAELFVDLGDEVEEFFSEHGRASIGFGYVLNRRWTLELLYNREKSRATVAEDFRTSHNVIEFNVRTSIRIRDLVKNQ